MKEYKQLPEEFAKKTLQVVGDVPFFTSPEGECAKCGTLMSWVRLSNCTLTCCWRNSHGSVSICDSPQSSHDTSKSLVVSMQEAYDKLMQPLTKWISITGGEPSVQTDVFKLADYIEEADKRVKIETNGTIFLPCNASMIVCSPKLQSSEEGLKLLADEDYLQGDMNNFLKFDSIKSRAEFYKKALIRHQQGRYKPDVLKQMLDFYQERIQFKFVINCGQDLQEVNDNYVNKFNIPFDQVWLMPQAICAAHLDEKAEWVIEMCKQFGYNYSDRIHIRIWGDKVGV